MLMLRSGRKVSGCVESITSDECPNRDRPCPCVDALRIGGTGTHHARLRGPAVVVRVMSTVSGPGAFCALRDASTGREFVGYAYMSDVCATEGEVT